MKSINLNLAGATALKNPTNEQEVDELEGPRNGTTAAVNQAGRGVEACQDNNLSLKEAVICDARSLS